MNPTIARQLDHRTIREFTDVPLTDEERRTLLDVANHTATSTGQQSYSILRITDGTLRQELAKVAGQEYLQRVPELFIFIVDVYRNARIAKEKGQEDLVAARDMDRFFQGFTDGCLAAQNLTVAAESMGLGCVYFGSLLNDVTRVIELLELPELTFPIVGVGVGHPNQEPQLKPRMDLEYKVFENTYPKGPTSYVEALKDYDETMSTYYDLRNANRRVDSFTDQVVNRLLARNVTRSRLVPVIVNQGFLLELEGEGTER